MRSSTDQADTPARPGRPRFTRKRSGPLRFLAPLLAVLVLLVLITGGMLLEGVGYLIGPARLQIQHLIPNVHI